MVRANQALSDEIVANLFLICYHHLLDAKEI